MYVTGPKNPESGWPTKQSREKPTSVALSPQSILADDLRTKVSKVDARDAIAVDQLFVDLLEVVADAKDVDPVPLLITARRLVLLAQGYSRPWREAGQPLAKLLDDGQGVPGVTIDELYSFIPPTREQDPVYQTTKQKSTNLLKQVKLGLAAVKEAIAKERDVLRTPPVASFTLAGRLGRNDAGDLVAIWKGPFPPQGKVWWCPARGDLAVAGNVDDKGVFQPTPSSGSAGVPLFMMTSESKRANGTKQQAAGREQ